MKKRCSCGHEFDWSTREFFDGESCGPEHVFYGVRMANCPRCDSTLALARGYAPAVEGRVEVSP